MTSSSHGFVLMKSHRKWLVKSTKRGEGARNKECHQLVVFFWPACFMLQTKCGGAAGLEGPTQLRPLCLEAACLAEGGLAEGSRGTGAGRPRPQRRGGKGGGAGRPNCPNFFFNNALLIPS